MLSKSRSQVLRIAPVLHVLFHLGKDGDVPDVVSEGSIAAAINFAKVSCQQTSVIAGKGSIRKRCRDVVLVCFNEMYRCMHICMIVEIYSSCDMFHH